jgi:hypothetical protein
MNKTQNKPCSLTPVQVSSLMQTVCCFPSCLLMAPRESKPRPPLSYPLLAPGEPKPRPSLVQWRHGLESVEGLAEWKYLNNLCPSLVQKFQTETHVIHILANHEHQILQNRQTILIFVHEVQSEQECGWPDGFPRWTEVSSRGDGARGGCTGGGSREKSLVNLVGRPRLVVRRRSGPIMGREKSPVSSPKGRTTRINMPMVRIKVGGRFGSERTGQRRKAKKVKSCAKVLE